MKKWMKFIIAPALAVSVFAGSAAFAADTAAPGATAAAGSCEKHEKHNKLGLTDDQKVKMKAVKEKYAPAMKPLVDQLRAYREEMRGLMTAATIDDAAIRAESAKMASVQADLAVQRAHKLAEVRAILTPEQIEKMKEKMSGWKGRREHGHGGERSDADGMM